MKIDRAIIKEQAKQLIKGRIIVLFVITLVVSLLTTSATVMTNTNSYRDRLNSVCVGVPAA